MSEPEAPRRSFTSTGFLTFLASWGGSLAVMLSNSDATVRAWGAVGMVALPALYLVCSTLIKRAQLRRSAPKAPSPLALVSSLLGPSGQGGTP